MEAWKHKVGLLAVFVSACVIIAAIWYCLFGYSQREMEKEGTLVYQTSEMIAG
ncbi:MAG: hypothetical protein ACLTKI_02685 [Lachnospiraceae bacterium]